jgi:hypothetical protein
MPPAWRIRLRRTGCSPPTSWGRGYANRQRPHFIVATPAEASGFCQRTLPAAEGEVGKRGTGPSLSIISTWRGFRAPPAISVPVRSAPPSIHFAFRATSPWALASPAMCSSSTHRSSVAAGEPLDGTSPGSGHVSQPPEAPSPPHAITVMTGVPAEEARGL